MDILRRADLSVPAAIDFLPAAQIDNELRALPAGSQICLVPLVDVRLSVGLLLPPAHHLLRNLRRQVQIHNPIRLWQLQQPVFKIEQPLEKRPALLSGQLRGLVHSVGGGVTVGNNQPAAFVKPSPILPVAGKAVHRIEGGSRIGIHIPGMAAKSSGEIQPDQRRGFLLIPGKLQPPIGDAPPVQLPAQQGGLGSLAGAICPFKHDKPALHMCALPYAAQKFILL